MIFILKFSHLREAQNKRQRKFSSYFWLKLSLSNLPPTANIFTKAFLNKIFVIPIATSRDVFDNFSTYATHQPAQLCHPTHSFVSPFSCYSRSAAPPLAEAPPPPRAPPLQRAPPFAGAPLNLGLVRGSRTLLLVGTAKSDAQKLPRAICVETE